MGYIVDCNGIFDGVKATRNPEYFAVSLRLAESFKGVVISPESLPKPNCTMTFKSEEMDRVKDLQPGHPYRFRLEAMVEPSKQDPQTGQNYPARVRFNFLDAKAMAGANK